MKRVSAISATRADSLVIGTVMPLFIGMNNGIDIDKQKHPDSVRSSKRSDRKTLSKAPALWEEPLQFFPAKEAKFFKPEKSLPIHREGAGLMSMAA